MEHSGVEGGSSVHDSVITQRKDQKKQKQMFIPYLQERDGIGKLITEPEQTIILDAHHQNSSLSFAGGVEANLPNLNVGDLSLRRRTVTAGSGT